MAQKKLTTAALKTLARGDWHDSILPGLILRIGINRRTWSARFHAGGAYRRVVLGHYPAMQLADARAAARRLIERLDSGAPPEPAKPHPRSALTLGALIDRYEAVRQREGQRIKRLPKTLRSLRRHLEPYLALPAGQFSKSNLRAARDVLIEAGTPVESNRLLAATSAMLRWAAAEDMVEVNFATAIRRTPERKRERVLTKGEIKAIWQACAKLGSYGRMVRFLLVTGQRRGEAAGLRYGDILDNTWRQTINKASRPHSLPLPPLALALVGQGEARANVFPRCLAFDKWKAQLDAASGVTDWRIHDLRRTAASSMQDLGIRHEVIEAILNHALPGISAVYLRSELELQKADALTTWAVALERIVGHGALVSA